MTADTAAIMAKLDSIQEQLSSLAERITGADILLTDDDKGALGAATADLVAGRTRRLV